MPADDKPTLALMRGDRVLTAEGAEELARCVRNSANVILSKHDRLLSTSPGRST
jgi:hypothetical protein